MRERLVAVTGAVLAGLAVLTSPAAAQTPEDDEEVDLGLYGAPVRITAPEGTTMELGSGRRLVDTLEVRPNPADDGAVVIADMETQAYVEGLGEMPASWHMEALKAQAVAGRTYAWYQIRLGTFQERGLGYDICATVACQVFRGRSVVETPEVGQRWAQAVAETEGEVLLYDGQPILARYFSTSGGATRDNEEVFRSEGPFPYLKGIPDPDDAISPLHTWRVEFTRAQFDDLLSRGQTLGPTVPIADAEVLERDDGLPNIVRVQGRDGTVAEVTAGEFKRFLNDVAPEIFPDDFPGERSDGGTLPSTVPTTRFTIAITEDRVVLDGSGWGHAVGMGQYGARGKAERGLSYDEILSIYYNGLEPTTTDRLPDRVRVGLADSVDEITVSADGPLQVTVEGTTITERALGTWRVAAGPDRTVRLLAPAGYGAPLVVAETTTTRSRPLPAEIVTLETVVNKPAELAVEVRDPDGEVVGDLPMGIVEAGRHTVDWSVDTSGGPLPPGRFEVALVAIDEDAARAGTATTVEVVAATADDRPVSLLGPLQLPDPSAGNPTPVMALAGLSGLAAGAAAGRLRSRTR